MRGFASMDEIIDQEIHDEGHEALDRAREGECRG